MNSIGRLIVTQQMVANAAGMHYSTVSLALRNDVRIPTGTRRKIRAVAKRLGYVPDPLVSLLMSRVRHRTAGYRGTVAYVHMAPADEPRLGYQILRNFLSGARTRAGELGYNLDEFFLGDDSRGSLTFPRILRARGIAALIVEHLSGRAFPSRRLPFDTGPFAAVSLGAPLAHPQLHYVANDQYMRAILGARELLRLGYKRLGMVSFDSLDTAMAHRCTAGFLAIKEYMPAVASVPICRLSDEPEHRRLREWLRRYRPDAILGTRDVALGMIKGCGLRVPDDVGWVHLDWTPRFKPSAGVHGNSEHTGAAAAELVISQLHRGELGPPTRAMSYLVAGSWVEGKSVRKVGSPIDLDAAFFSDSFRA